MSKKISLNPKYTTIDGVSWSTTAYNGLEYHISTNKSNSSVSTLQCEFTTPYDNIDVVIEIGSSSENNYDWCYVGPLDDSGTYQSNYLDRISGMINNAPKFKTITINVAKAGFHFLRIGYRKDGSGNAGNDCGYFRLVTTEVDSLKPDPYIYCGTKTVVSEEPIKFTKTNISNGNNGNRNWIDYQGTSKDYLWEANVGDKDSYKTAKISFTTSNDNVTVILKYSIRLRGDSFGVSNLDSDIGTNMMIYEGGIVDKTITKEITVPKAGEHFIWIEYHAENLNSYIYVGFSSTSTNVVTTTKTLLPESILAYNKNIGKVYVGSELIWSKPMNNTISWETLTWNKSNNSYTYNTKGKLYINYSYDNNNYGTYLLSSPASVPHKDEITKIEFYNINSYQGNSYNCTYKLDLSWVNTYKFNSMYNMFSGCSSLTNLDVSNFNTSNVTDMRSMFNNCSSLTYLDVSNFNTSKVTSIYMVFYKCNALTYLDVSKWDTSKVTSMYGMFYNCNKLTRLDVSNFNTSNVTDMNYMFNICSSITYLDVSKWDTSKVTNMQYVFNGCMSLTSLDVSKWDTSKVTSMYGMFYNCNNLTSLDVSNFNTSNVIEMYAMFSGCNNLTSLDVSNFNTSKVTNMNFMFTNCNNLTSLDVSNFNTSNVTSMQYMFFGCRSLTKLDLSKWNVSNVTNISNIFNYCSSLTTLIDGHESDSYLEALYKLKVDIDLSTCVKLNYESVYAVFNGLATVTGKTITLPKVMQGKLNEIKLKIPKRKGWAVAYK